VTISEFGLSFDSLNYSTELLDSGHQIVSLHWAQQSTVTYKYNMIR